MRNIYSTRNIFLLKPRRSQVINPWTIIQNLSLNESIFLIKHVIWKYHVSFPSRKTCIYKLLCITISRKIFYKMFYTSFHKKVPPPVMDRTDFIRGEMDFVDTYTRRKKSASWLALFRGDCDKDSFSIPETRQV